MKRIFANIIRPRAIATTGLTNGVNLDGVTVKATATERALGWRAAQRSAERDAFANVAGDLRVRPGYEP